MRQAVGLVEDDVGDAALRIELDLATDAKDIPNQSFYSEAGEVGLT